MSLFNKKKQADSGADKTVLAEMALMTIHDGVIITNKTGAIQFINPAAVTMTEFDSQDSAIGLDYGILIKLETKEGRELPDNENSFMIAMNNGQNLDRFAACLIGTKSGKRIPIAISVVVADGGNRIVTFRDITKELAEEGEQAEFISTASHEMRTPVASI